MDQRTARLSVAPREGERPADQRQGGGLRAIGGTASRVAAPIVRRHGGGVLARLKTEWSVVAGPELAALTWPEALGRDGALKLRVEPRVALELQHRAPQLIERINVFFGRTAVARLVLLQGPLPLAESPYPPPPLAGDQGRTLDTSLADIADPALRQALAELGRLVMRRASED